MTEASKLATSESVTAVLEVLKTIATFILGLVSNIVDVVISSPLLLIPIGVVMLRTVISVFRSLY